jgi:cytochrome c2
MMLRPTLIVAAATTLARTLLAEITPGELLMGEMNCVACHSASPKVAARLASRRAPRLAGDGVGVAPRWIREFLDNPQKVKPGTLMPDMLHGLPPGEKSEVVEALTHFLVSIQPAAIGASGESSAALIDGGRKLYHEIGCAQCHAPETLPAGRTGDPSATAELDMLRQTAVPLGNLDGKYSVRDLARLLRDPLRSRPSGRMPSSNLTATEAEAIAAYLLRAQAQEKTLVPPDGADFTVDKAKAQRGASFFFTLRCADCHEDALAGIVVDAKRAPVRAFDLLRPRQPVGCLSAKPKPNQPKFDITDRQRAVILATLQNQAVLSAPLTPEQQVKRTMTVLNCYACHSRDRRGGPEGMRREYFTGVGGADLGEEGRIPPSLTHVGAKLQSDWLRKVVVDGAGVRPNMATRMPAYGEANAGHLPALFEEADARPDANPLPDVVARDDANDSGRKLLGSGSGGLGCITCHDFAGKKSTGLPGLDLATTAQRLKWDWFRRYLLDPQSMRSGTRMPSFWPSGVAANKELPGGDPEKQIAAIWAYLAGKNFTELPPGLTR